MNLKKKGRKRKLLKELTSRTSLYKRKVEIEGEFQNYYGSSIFDFACWSVNHHEFLICEGVIGLYNYLQQHLNNEFVQVKKINERKILEAKDNIMLSYKKLYYFRKVLNLQKIIPSRDKLMKYTSEINNLIKQRYDLQISDECCVIGNIHQVLFDYISVFIKKYPAKKNFNLTWTCDQRKLHQPIGNVGIAIQLLEETDNQSPDKQCYICIGNGKENIELG